MKTVEAIRGELLNGSTFGYQCVGDEATLCVGIPKGRVRPALWVSSGKKTVMLAQFHGEAEAALAIKFLDQHSDAVQHVIDRYNTQEKGNGST